MTNVARTGQGTTTLSAEIRASLERRGPATAVRWKRYGLWQTMNGTQMAARIAAIGDGLRAIGLAAGEVAAVIGDNCVEWVLADLGIVSAGAVSAGFDAHIDADELARLVEQCGARVLFVAGDEELHKAPRVRERCPTLEHIVVMHEQWDDGTGEARVMSLAALEAAAGQARSAAPAAPAPDAPAAIVYSSGVTGPARGAILSHGAIAAQAARAASALGLRADDERLALTPIHHVLERVVGIYASLLSGVVVNFPESAETALLNLVELQPTVVQASPQVWSRLRSQIELILPEVTPFQRWACRRAFALGAAAGPDEPAWRRLIRRLTDRLVLMPIRLRLGLARARICLSAGAIAQPEVGAWFAALGRPLADLYGLAETGGAVAVSAAFGGQGASAAILEVRLGEGDEIQVRGDAVLLAYAGGDAEVALAEGWWGTGDLGRRDEGGQIRVLGHVGNVLQTRSGKRIVPFGREQALRASPYVADAFLYLDSDDRLRARILLDSDNVVKYAQDRAIPFTHFQSLCRAEEIRRLVDGIVAELNRAEPATPIEGYSLIERSLALGDVELSPTLTLRRHLLRDDG